MSLSADEIVRMMSDVDVLKSMRAHMERENRVAEARLVEKLGNIRNFQQMQRMMVRRACPNMPDTDIVLHEQHVRQLEEELALVQEAWRQERTVIDAAIDKFRASPTMDTYPTFIELGEKLDRIKVETERRSAAIRAAR